MGFRYDIAIRSTHKYAVRASGDVARIVDRPDGGVALLVIDGQGSGPSARAAARDATDAPRSSSVRFPPRIEPTSTSPLGIQFGCPRSHIPIRAWPSRVRRGSSAPSTRARPSAVARAPCSGATPKLCRTRRAPL